MCYSRRTRRDRGRPPLDACVYGERRDSRCDAFALPYGYGRMEPGDGRMLKFENNNGNFAAVGNDDDGDDDVSFNFSRYIWDLK